jgi:hypothetical protein
MLKLFVKIMFLFTSITFNSLAAKTTIMDVTNNWTFRGEVVSAFPQAMRRVELKENFLVYKVFTTKDELGKEVRFEVFYTGDDAEYYPQFYIITNASESSQWPSSGRGKAYYISDFSSPDRELGETPPKIDPFDLSSKELKSYILNTFLNSDLTIKLK